MPDGDVLCICHLILNCRVLRSVLFHIWHKLNLPMFLLSVGLLTIRYTDSLIFLAMPWSSLPIMWKFSCIVMWLVVLLWWCIGEGSLWCSLNLCPGGLSYIFFITCKLLTLEPANGSTFLRHWVLVLGRHQNIVIVLLPLKWVCMPY